MSKRKAKKVGRTAFPEMKDRGSSTRRTRYRNLNGRPPELPRNPAAPFAVQGTQPVRVRLEKKGRKGKTVSIITGVKSPDVGKRALAKHLKDKLGSGGAVKGADIEIQGDQRERLVALLNELGYRAKQG